jgi:chromosome segregation protein
LESIDLENFLSFRAGSISFLLDEGNVSRFTILTGPNGAGKSSVFQALKFVLGSNAKDGRYAKWDGFINHGAEYLRVRAKFRDEGGDCIEIERLLRKDHATTFLLNGKASTAAKVLATVKGMGLSPDNIFSFVAQGHVNAIKELSPEQLFFLIETGMGMDGLRVDIEEKATHLAGLHEQVTDLGQQRGSFEKQDKILKERLDRYLEKKELEDELVHLNAEKKWAQHVDIECKITEKKESIDTINADIENATSQMEDLKLGSAGLEAQKNETGDHIIESKVLLGSRGEALAAIKEEIKAWDGEKKDLFEENEDLKRQAEDVKNSIASLDGELDLAATARDALVERVDQANGDRESLKKRQEEIRDELVKNQDWLDTRTTIKKEIDDEMAGKATNEALLQSLEKDIGEAMKQVEDLNHELRNANWYFELSARADPKQFLTDQVKKFSTDLEQKQASLQAKRRDEVEFRKQYSGIVGTRNMEPAVPEEIDNLKREIEARNLQDRIKGPIYEFLEFDPKHAKALEAAFKKNALLGFVAFTEEDFTLLNSLRNKFKLQAFIYHPKQNRPQAPPHAAIDFPGAIDYLHNLVIVPDWLEPVVNDIVRDTVLVDSFTTAVALAKEDDRIHCVTLDGTLVDSGKYTVKSAPRYQGRPILGVAEDDDARSLGTRLDLLVTTIKEMEDQLDDLKKQKQEAEAKLADADRIRVIVKQKEAMSKRTAEHRSGKDELKHKMELADATIVEAIQRLEAHENLRPKAILNLTTELGEVDASIDALQSAISRFQHDIATTDANRTDTEMKRSELASREQAIAAEHTTLLQKIKQGASEFKAVEAKMEEIKREMQDIDASISANEAELETIRSQLEERVKDQTTLEFRVKAMALDAEKLAQEITGLEKEQAYIETNLKGFARPEVMKSIEECDAAIQSVRDTLAKPEYVSIGEDTELEYNRNRQALDAIDVKLAEVSEEIEKITAISEDLKSTYFSKIEGHVNLLETHVNEKFGSIQLPFRIMLKTSGTFQAPRIEITVDFHDGNAYPIAALSEGQKTIVALALMLTLQDLNPSPICIFDEAHIFLDDSNKELVSKLIRQTADHVQLIMLIPTTSHNFIKAADKVIGIVRQGMKEEPSENGEPAQTILGPSQVIELEI